MGWIFLIVSVALILLALWRFGRFGSTALQFSAAALLLAVAGYVFQGSPTQPSASVQTPEDLNTETVPGDMRRTFASSMNAEGQWIALSDALMKAGRTRAAVSILTEGTRKAPGNADVWVGLGNALFVHGGGQMNPAAQYAFERAASISPNHPGPPFFFGYALAKSGKMAEAGEVWRGLLERAPADAPWKADLEQRLAEIGQSSVKPQK
jgi:cytochrome c-type biogenesis protein CcmH